MRRPLIVALVLGGLGCGAPHPVADPQEHVRGEHHRLIREPADRLWPALLRALDDEGVEVAHADQARGTILTRKVVHTGRDAARRLGDIADLSHAREEGAHGLAEYEIVYQLALLPAPDGATRLKITSAIEAVSRGDTAILGGVLQTIPHHVELPSRGVAERDLMRRLGSSLFAADEMLLVLGEPGVD